MATTLPVPAAVSAIPSRLALLAALASGVALPALAQDAVPFELEEIVFSPAREPVEARRTGATVTVLTAEDIRATGETRATDILARLPGVGVLARGPLGNQAGLTLRGASQNYIRVVVDGIEVSDPSAPQSAFDFGRMTTLGLGRIELLRGTQSATWGSQAIAGVLSFSSLPAELGRSQTLELEAGSFATLRAAYAFSQRDADWGLAFSLSRVSSAGFSAAEEADGNTEPDGFRGTRVSAAVDRSLDSGWRIGANAFFETTWAEFDEQFPIGDGLTPDEVSESLSYGLRVFAEVSAFGVDHSLSATRFVIDRSLSGTNAFGFSQFDYLGQRTVLAYQGATDLGAAGRLVFGADATWEGYAEASSFDASDGGARIYGVFAEAKVEVSPTLDVSAALRQDWHSEFGGFLTGRAGVAWRPGDGWIVRAQAGTGFRAPSLYELYGPYGNAGLVPERSRSYDLGLERRLAGGGFLRATLFRLEVEDLIDFASLALPPFGQYVQIPGRSLRQGVELEGRLPLGERLTAGLAYTYTAGQTPPISSGSAWNANFPRHDAVLTLSGRITDRLSGALSLQHVAGRAVLDDYTLLNGALSYDLGGGAQAFLRIENITNAQYQLVQGYGTANRSVYVGLRRSF